MFEGLIFDRKHKAGQPLAAPSVERCKWFYVKCLCHIKKKCLCRCEETYPNLPQKCDFRCIDCTYLKFTKERSIHDRWDLVYLSKLLTRILQYVHIFNKTCFDMEWLNFLLLGWQIRSETAQEHELPIQIYRFKQSAFNKKKTLEFGRDKVSHSQIRYSKPEESIMLDSNFYQKH